MIDEIMRGWIFELRSIKVEIKSFNGKVNLDFKCIQVSNDFQTSGTKLCKPSL